VATSKKWYHSESVYESGGSPYKSPYTAKSFRANLGKLTGGQLKGYDAHHVFPQKFAAAFAALGISINDPRFGAWWEGVAHAENSLVYNRQWTAFF
jgi:hypothetical protein